jgi:hypothetical protein
MSRSARRPPPADSMIGVCFPQHREPTRKLAVIAGLALAADSGHRHRQVPPGRRKTVPAGGNRGCPGAADARRMAGAGTGRGLGGRAALPCRCCFRARCARPGTSAAALVPGLRGMPSSLLPSSASAACHAGASARDSSVVHSITRRRPGSGVCHLEWDDPRNPPNALRASAVVLRRHTGHSPGPRARFARPVTNASP